MVRHSASSCAPPRTATPCASVGGPDHPSERALTHNTTADPSASSKTQRTHVWGTADLTRRSSAACTLDPPRGPLETAASTLQRPRSSSLASNGLMGNERSGRPGFQGDAVPRGLRVGDEAFGGAGGVATLEVVAAVVVAELVLSKR
jgi:hypothetical protein